MECFQLLEHSGNTVEEGSERVQEEPEAGKERCETLCSRHDTALHP